MGRTYAAGRRVVGGLVLAVPNLRCRQRCPTARDPRWRGEAEATDKYGPARLEAAYARAVEVGEPSCRTVKGILAAGTEAWSSSRLLCQDEVARRAQAAFARRLCRAHFEEQVSLEGFEGPELGRGGRGLQKYDFVVNSR